MFNQSLGLVLTTALTFSFTGAPTLATVPAPDVSSPTEELVSLKFPQAGDRGGPQTTTGGGTRGGSCFLEANSNLRVVAPSLETTTVSPNPSLFVFVPATRDADGEFVLVDSDGELIFEQEMDLPEGDSIVGITLPASVQLEGGETYAWALGINCEVDGQFVGTAVEATLKKENLQPELAERVEQTNRPLDRASIYANQGIWQDTLAIVAGLEEQAPDELVELLTSVGLGQLSGVPIVFVDVPD